MAIEIVENNLKNFKKEYEKRRKNMFFKESDKAIFVLQDILQEIGKLSSLSNWEAKSTLGYPEIELKYKGKLISMPNENVDYDEMKRILKKSIVDKRIY